MTSYVLGFLFTPDEQHVVLLQKTHGPADMAGKFNGVGGKIEVGESALAAMERETREEIGLAGVAWLCYGRMYGLGWECHLFRAHDERAAAAEGQEDEKVFLVDPLALPMDAMRNLSWLIPVALEAEALAEIYYATERPSTPSDGGR